MRLYCKSRLEYDQSLSRSQISYLVLNRIEENGVKHLSTAHWPNLSTLNLGNQTLSELKMQLETWGVSG